MTDCTSRFYPTMEILAHHSLQPYNTFGMAVSARHFARINGVTDLQELLTDASWTATPRMVLGGGSNVLFTRNFDGIVLQIALPGITVTEDHPDHLLLKVGAGENWHRLVLFCVQHGYAGIENLSLIPGNVGAAPMQNIGAYGVELKAVFHELEAVNVETGALETFSAEACEFGYRTSVFKTRLRNQRIITSVTLRLQKTPSFNTSYGAIEKELEAMGVTDLSIAAISQAVCNIRSSKLPDPAEIGNAGSFFKNPVIDNAHFEDLKRTYPEIVGYPNGTDHTKVAAGWLIERAGWKGKRIDNYGVHTRQALVLVNYGGAKGQQILDLSSDIMASIHEQFGIALEREVNIV
ncbi:MAG: UDP-N-acetylmuramate dehydrogenase [Bacteroidota bacterium]